MGQCCAPNRNSNRVATDPLSKTLKHNLAASSKDQTNKGKSEIYTLSLISGWEH